MKMGKSMKQRVLRLCLIIGMFVGVWGGWVHAPPPPAQASPNSQINPILQCSTSILLLSQGLVLKALPQLEESVETLKKDPGSDQQMLGMCALYLGVARQNIGDYYGALSPYETALGAFRESEDQYQKQMEWSALYGIASVHLAQRNSVHLAQRNYVVSQMRLEEALGILQDSNDASWSFASIKRLAEGATYNNLGIVKGMQQNWEESRSALEKSLTIFREIKASDDSTDSQDDNPFASLIPDLSKSIKDTAIILEPLILNNIGETYRRQENVDVVEARGKFTEGLEVLKAIDPKLRKEAPGSVFLPFTEATLHNNMGLIQYFHDNDIVEARKSFTKTLELLRDSPQRIALASVLVNLGFLEQREGNLDPALEYYKEAMDLNDQIRITADSSAININTGGDGGSISNAFAFQGSLVDLIDVYYFAADIYVEQKEYAEAFHTTERGRARLFLDMLADVQFQFEDTKRAELLRKERKASIECQAAKDIYDQAEYSSTFLRSKSQIKEQADEACEIHKKVMNEIRNGDDPLLNQMILQEGVLDAKAVQELLDEQTTLIAYYSYDPRLEDNRERMGLQDAGPLAFVLTQGQINAIELSSVATPEKINNLAQQIRDNQYTSKDSYNETLKKLYNLLVKPLAEKKYLKTTQIAQIAIVPHLHMHKVPFAGLFNGNTYFGEDYTLFTLPSASTLQLVQQNANAEKEGGKPLVLGSPNVPGLPTISSSSTEARSIAVILSTEAYTDTYATEKLVREEAAGANIIHLSAHASYSETDPLSSTIYLTQDDSQDGNLQAHEIFTMRLPKTSLVVLSSCEANWGEPSNADEVVALNRAFFVAGSPSVLASLWVADPKATQMLMETFYKEWRREGKNKAAALRAAQKTVRETKEFESPYYWAGFVLNGDPGTGTPAAPPAPTEQTTSTATTVVKDTPTPTEQTISTATAFVTSTISTSTPTASITPTPVAGTPGCIASMVLIATMLTAIGIMRKIP